MWRVNFTIGFSMSELIFQGRPAFGQRLRCDFQRRILWKFFENTDKGILGNLKAERIVDNNE